MFFRVSIPTRSGGPVYAYSRDDFVDPGPTARSVARVWSRRSKHASVAGDIEQVLVTHPHPDHVGMANRLPSEGPCRAGRTGELGNMGELRRTRPLNRPTSRTSSSAAVSHARLPTLSPSDRKPSCPTLRASTPTARSRPVMPSPSTIQNHGRTEQGHSAARSPRRPALAGLPTGAATTCWVTSRPTVPAGARREGDAPERETGI
ncbi:hypothetical protein C9J85_07475 [Haloferax sp. wsp5]|nr:hypothetical protein C9J85_07475 [Haloferax sp. wsp5]